MTDNSASRVVFISKPVRTDSIVCVQFSVNLNGDSNRSLFSHVVLRARELIFSFANILACPVANGGRVIVAGNAELFDQSKFRTKCEKLKLTAEAELSCSPETLGRCLKYTVLAKLAPEWNKVGEWLFNGRQFLHNGGSIPCVCVDLRFPSSEIEILVTAKQHRFPLLQPSELAIDQAVLKQLQLNKSR